MNASFASAAQRAGSPPAGASPSAPVHNHTLSATPSFWDPALTNLCPALTLPGREPARGGFPAYSHSMVLGGFEEIS
jgi:hypothetical protein